MRFIAIKCILH